MLSLGRISCNPTLSGLDREGEGDIDGKWQKILPCLVVVFGCADAYSFGGFIDLALKNK